MDYDYTGVESLRHDRATGRLELTSTDGKRVIREGVKNLFVKEAKWIEPDGTVHFRNARVSIGESDAVAGD